MTDASDRFKKRKALLGAAGPAATPSTVLKEQAAPPDGHFGLVVEADGAPAEEAATPDALLDTIRARISAQKIDALIESCQRECLHAVVGPLGVARILFEDQDGGSVDTVHNVRQGVYATDAEKAAYGNRGEYDTAAYHGHEDYTARNAQTSAEQKGGGTSNAYSNGTITIHDKKNQDHVVAAKEVHDDPGRVLAEVDGPTLANRASNLKATTEFVNKSKKEKAMADYIAYVDDKKKPALKNKIAALEAAAELSAHDQQNLAKYRAQLAELEALDYDKMRAADEAARRDQNSAISRAYYRSAKFARSAAITSLAAGGRMGLQQALAMVMEEFVRAAFAEVRDIWSNGFKGKVDDSFLDAIRHRLTRVAQRVQEKWKGAVLAGLEGGISGFLSNLVTVLINAFVTTKSAVVRMVREGFMSLYRAMKTLAFPEADQPLSEAADAAAKILAAGVITAGGIALEGALEPYLLPFGPLAPYLSTVSVGLVTGLSTAFAIHLLDHLDLFGVNAKARHDRVIGDLEAMVSLSAERIAKATEAFKAPALSHLAE